MIMIEFESDLDVDCEFPALARNTDPLTSHEAAEQFDAKALVRKILAILESFPEGLCCTELAAMIGCGRDSVSPRMPSMVKHGQIEACGKRIPNGGRVNQIIWRLTADYRATIVEESSGAVA